MPLHDTDIPGLRQRILSNVSTTRLEAERFNVGQETIRRAVRGETFRHIRDYLDEPPGKVTGVHAEHATRHPVPPPLDTEAALSLARVISSTPPLDPDAAIDEFLNRDKKD